MKKQIEQESTTIRFRELFREYMSLSGCGRASRLNYRTMCMYLEKFCLHEYDEPNMFISDFDLRFITRFSLWLRQQHPANFTTNKTTATLKPSSVKLNVNLLKAVFHFAERREFLDYYPFKNFDPKLATALKHGADMLDRKLSRNDLRMIENTNPGPRLIAQTRMIFLVQRWTGMAWADLHKYKLLQKQIRHNLDQNRIVITYNRVKTGELAIIPLFPELKVILEKLKYDVDPGSYGNYYKNTLKLFEFFEIPLEGLGTHTGRHVFGSEMLEMGFSMEAVSRMMGHSSIKETENVYARVNQDKIFADMKRLEKPVAPTPLISTQELCSPIAVKSFAFKSIKTI